MKIFTIFASLLISKKPATKKYCCYRKMAPEWMAEVLRYSRYWAQIDNSTILMDFSANLLTLK